jgi:L-ornithine Nalpha-acyltransferase
MNAYRPYTPAKKTGLIVKQAVTQDELIAALRLRYEIFNLEMNEGLVSSDKTGLDRDEYDLMCDHIIVVDAERQTVVGTYRMLLGSEAERNIGYYSETEFEMSSFRKLQGEKLELGRACVRRDYRCQAVLGLMWSFIAGHIDRFDVRYVFGCGSIHTINPAVISSIYGHLRSGYMSSAEFRVTPLKKAPGFNPNLAPNMRLVSKHMPPLLCAYLRLGAQIAGEPAFDEEFGVSDFLFMLHRNKLTSRYRNRFFESSNASA